MKFLADLLGMLAFRKRALRAQAERRAPVLGVLCFSAGFLAYTLVRNSVYATELLPQPSDPIGMFFNLNLVQSILFLLLVYVPVVIILSNDISWSGLGLSFSKQEYREHLSALMPLWGILYLITAPMQWLAPRLRDVAVVEYSIAALVRLVLILIYTLWSIKQLNYLSLTQALGAFVLSWFTVPVYYLLTSFPVALMLFIMIPLIYLGSQQVRRHLATRKNEPALRQNLHTLHLNPQDAEAHYQIGLIHGARRNPEAAGRYFLNALKIDPRDPKYHYSLGRVHESEGEWAQALERYSETYRLNPEYGLGDISREIGKGYLNTGEIEKGMEFLNSFLAKRGSDPEGRYWLAVALQKSGDPGQMRSQLSALIEQARSNSRLFRKENREWIYRARNMIRGSRSSTQKQS